MSNQQIELWQGPFGDFYQERNMFTDEEVSKRLALLQNIFQVIYMNCNGKTPVSVLEVGAGQGQNLAAIDKMSKILSIPIKLYATEINQKARLRLKENVPVVEILDDIPKQPLVDLAFTYGVLIHTHPAHLMGLQRRIFDCSNRWIVCAEYFAPECRSMPYRGEKDALWLDDYGSRWLDNFPLRCLGYCFLWKRISGLDNVTVWMFEKTGKMH